MFAFDFLCGGGDFLDIKNFLLPEQRPDVDKLSKKELLSLVSFNATHTHRHTHTHTHTHTTCTYTHTHTYKYAYMYTHMHTHTVTHTHSTVHTYHC